MTDKYSPLSGLNQDSPSILKKIVEQRQKRVDELKAEGLVLNPEPSRRSLVASLQASRSGLILECKQSSPSRGLLKDNYQPAEIARCYSPFASGISVLTEPDFFTGSLEHLSQVSEVAQQPVLCKDFIVDTHQLYRARAAGADAVLLMLSVISNDFWMECYQITEQLGLDIITEVHNQQELDRALQLPAKIIGINNRNLHTLNTDLAVTERLVKSIPADRLIISESGISTHQQLRRLAPLVDGFLIGSSLMQTDFMDMALRNLVFGEIKICGLTRREDADLAWQLGASYGGIIFTPVSSRYQNIEQARSLCTDQPMPMVGVFMDQNIDEIAEIARELDLSAVQLHGNESKSDVQQLRDLLPEYCAIWKVISCSEVNTDYPSVDETLPLIDDWHREGVDRILIDTPKDGASHQLNYRAVLNDKRVLIAGGLSAEAVHKLKLEADFNQKVGFDLCSAIESDPGIKDHQKLKDLFRLLQPATRNNIK